MDSQFPVWAAIVIGGTAIIVVMVLCTEPFSKGILWLLRRITGRLP